MILPMQEKASETILWSTQTTHQKIFVSQARVCIFYGNCSACRSPCWRFCNAFTHIYPLEARNDFKFLRIWAFSGLLPNTYLHFGCCHYLLISSTRKIIARSVMPSTLTNLTKSINLHLVFFFINSGRSPITIVFCFSKELFPALQELSHL